MPCKPQKARKLLESGKAKVVSRVPFTIKLLHGSSGYKQEITAGMDTGSETVGCAAIANGKVIYQSEVKMRTDVSKKMQRRAMYRRNRRGRKCRYRKPRFLNRSSARKAGRLAPSLLSKLQSHLREKAQIEKILPISHWKVETASFDIHKITNPDVSGEGYQKGKLKGYYNVKAFVLNRDNYKCLSGRKINHSKELHVHHIIFKSKGGTNMPDNLLTLCKTCHSDLHAGEFEIKAKKSKTKHATEMGIIKARLLKLWNFEETFGYETKFKREQVLNLAKSHSNDAIAICCGDNETVKQSKFIIHKRHVAKGDYQQTKGVRSEKIIPTGKLFGFKKHDFIQTDKGKGFVKGKRSNGYFSLETILGEIIHNSVNIKKNAVRLTARTTTLTQIMEMAIHPVA